MQAIQLQNLKTLIHSSPVLDQAEREEWLALLEIMNDKQLLELQKILEEAKTQEAGSRKQETGESKREIRGQETRAENNTAKPGFSHIMNLPHPEKPVPLPPKQGQSFQARPPIVKTTEPSFMQKMKNIFAEKELPPGHPEAVEELELPSPKSQNPGLPDKKQQSGALGPKPPVKPPTVQNQPNKEPARPVLAKTAPSPAKPRLPVSQQPELEHISPGIKVPQVSEKAKSELLESIKKASASFPGFSASRQPSAAARNAVLLKPEEAANLEAADLNLIKSEALSNRLRDLVQKYGYHQVIFYLEQSPLYKDYLATGTRLLSEQASFEEADHSGQKGILSREEFEEVADLLRQIQAS